MKKKGMKLLGGWTAPLSPCWITDPRTWHFEARTVKAKLVIGRCRRGTGRAVALSFDEHMRGLALHGRLLCRVGLQFVLRSRKEGQKIEISGNGTKRRFARCRYGYRPGFGCVESKKKGSYLKSPETRKKMRLNDVRRWTKRWLRISIRSRSEKCANLMLQKSGNFRSFWFLMRHCSCYFIFFPVIFSFLHPFPHRYFCIQPDQFPIILLFLAFNKLLRSLIDCDTMFS